jgi:3-hydroxyisobutyrate dehydrogenase-like beta-hydroxyacid dehydrogenase
MPFRAEDGTLTMMFGGSTDMFANMRPCLEVMGEFIVHCGEVGMGQLMKAFSNIEMGFSDQPKSAVVKVYERYLGQEVCLPADGDP